MKEFERNNKPWKMGGFSLKEEDKIRMKSLEI